MGKIRAVFDIDDVICDNNGRDYKNAIPNKEVINKINYLHDELGFEIVLYTARGMISCNGDIGMIKAKNENILVDWLARNYVCYDELIFGKPIADFYVDDKALSLSQFLENDFCKLSGGSGAEIYRLGNIVKKVFKTSEELLNVKKWYLANKGLLNAPKLISCVYNSMFMEFVGGKLACDNFNVNVFVSLLYYVGKEKEEKYDHFDFKKLLDSFSKHENLDEGIDAHIIKCKGMLSENKNIIEENASFSHGDMALGNVIVRDNGALFFIDPRYDKDCSSYLFDLAKIRMSLDGYERYFGLSEVDNRMYVDALDAVLKKNGILEAVISLEYMYLLRLAYYKEDKGKLLTFIDEFCAKYSL